MFLDLDKKDRDSIAVIDDSGQSLTYGDICNFSKEFAKHLPERCLIFILSENKIGSLLGYTSALSNRIVPLIMSAKTDKGLYENLRYMSLHLLWNSWPFSSSYSPYFLIISSIIL